MINLRVAEKVNENYGMNGRCKQKDATSISRYGWGPS